MKTTGIIQLKFKEGVKEEIIEKTIADIYFKNKNIIDGMEYNQFDKEETLIEINRKIKGWCQE